MDLQMIRNRMTKILVDMMFVASIIACIILPFAMPWLLRITGVSPDLRLFYTVMMVGAGVCGIYILHQLRGMFKTVIDHNPFVASNVSSLRKCAVASAIIALIFGTRLVMWFTFSVAIIVVTFSLLCLLCLTIKDLFKQAVAYKEENDWTV